MTGTLFLVATPIGNLADISQRALSILDAVDLIAAEDTRHTRKLLSHYQIKAQLISYHEHNERERAEELLGFLQSGQDIALVSDAGTPGISDPGYRLVHLCREAGIVVSPVPGPTAVIAALSVSGLPTDQFYFGGFLPVKEGKKRTFLAKLKDLPATLVFYEAPQRVLKTLQILQEVLGDRQAVLLRELTKVHEEFLGGCCSDLQQLWSQQARKGEVVIVVAGQGKQLSKKIPCPVLDPQPRRSHRL